MKYLLVLMVLICTSCESTEESHERDRNHQISDMHYWFDNSPIRYLKDERTNLCFAYHNLSYNNAIFTNVPCSDEVVKMLDK